MRAVFPLIALLLTCGSGSLAARTQGAGSDIGAALDGAESAEIYVVRQDLAFVTSPDPLTVRRLGCRYVVRRNSAAWHDLRASLGSVAIRPAPRQLFGELRLGLVLSERRGTTFEAYGSWPAPEAARGRGLSPRRGGGGCAKLARAPGGLR